MNRERKVILFIAQSLDGYIAKEDHSLDWLFKVEGEGSNGYEEFYATVDTEIIGRKTYEQVLILENGELPNMRAKRYVVSNTMSESNHDISFVRNEEVADLIRRLKKEDGKNIWVVGGGELIHTFIKEQLIDEYIITYAPSIIGNGIPLFKKQEFETDLVLKEVKRFNQFAQLVYEVKR